MATVTNMSDQAVSIPTGKGRAYFFPPRKRLKAGGTQEEEVEPKSVQPIPDDEIEIWLRHDLNKQAVTNRQILVVLDSDKPVDEVAVAAPAGKPENWKALVARIATITDVDELEGMYANETRPRVREALESRIGEIVA